MGLGRGVLEGSGTREHCAGRGESVCRCPQGCGDRGRQKGQGLDVSTSLASRLPTNTPHTCPAPHFSPGPVTLSQLTHCPPRNTQAASFI